MPFGLTVSGRQARKLYPRRFSRRVGLLPLQRKWAFRCFLSMESPFLLFVNDHRSPILLKSCQQLPQGFLAKPENVDTLAIYSYQYWGLFDPEGSG